MKREETMRRLAVALSALLVASPAMGFDKAQVERLLQTKECIGCDLNDADLTGADLKNARLKEAKLSNANLTGADLSGAGLRRAILNNANLTNANLTGALLADADLSGATWVDGRKCAQGSTGECK
jgi:uncharacterized protein YjbI with pentapeptide repeats